MPDHAPTVRELARLLGLSPAAVSQALNGRGRLSPETRARVLEAARALGYTPRYAAQSLATGRTHRLQLVVFAPAGEVLGFLPRFLRGAERAARRAGYHLALTLAESLEALDGELKALVRARALDGAILVNPPEAGPYPLPRALPHVVLGRPGQGEAVRVDSDNRAIGREVGLHLKEMGYAKPLFLAPLGLTFARDRLLGLKEVFPEALALEAPPGLEGAYRALQAALGRLPFDAVVAGSDEQAAGALRALKEAGLSVPEAVGVVGADDDLAPYLDPPLTSVDPGPEALGAQGVEVLLALLRGEAVPPLTLVPHTLKARRSSLRRLTPT